MWSEVAVSNLQNLSAALPEGNALISDVSRLVLLAYVWDISRPTSIWVIDTDVAFYTLAACFLFRGRHDFLIEPQNKLC
jgi:hypothetical protein